MNTNNLKWKLVIIESTSKSNLQESNRVDNWLCTCCTSEWKSNPSQPSTATDVTGDPATDVTRDPATDVNGDPATDINGDPATDITGEPATEVNGDQATDITGDPATDITDDVTEFIYGIQKHPCLSLLPVLNTSG